MQSPWEHIQWKRVITALVELKSERRNLAGALVSNPPRWRIGEAPPLSSRSSSLPRTPPCAENAHLSFAQTYSQPWCRHTFPIWVFFRNWGFSKKNVFFLKKIFSFLKNSFLKKLIILSKKNQFFFELLVFSKNLIFFEKKYFIEKLSFSRSAQFFSKYLVLFEIIHQGF